MRGTVDKIWHNQRTDGSEYWLLSIDGQRYSTWDKNMLVNIQEGDVVEFAFAHSGRYRNLTALKRTGTLKFSATEETTINSKSLYTVRMSCLRAAAELLGDSNLLPEQKVALTIKIAEKLQSHVLSSQCSCLQPEQIEKPENGQDKNSGHKVG